MESKSKKSSNQQKYKRSQSGKIKKPKQQKVQDEIAHSPDIDFNTNIYKQYCDGKNEIAFIKKQNPIEDEHNKELENLILEHNTNYQTNQTTQEGNNNNNYFNINNNYNSEKLNSIERSNSITPDQIPQENKISNDQFNTNAIINNSMPFDEIKDQKIKEQIQRRQKQEEQRKMLDEQILQRTQYKQKPQTQIQSYFNISNNNFIPNQYDNITPDSISISYPSQTQSKDNNIQRYQNILDKFCESKMKVLNEQNMMHNNCIIQKYQNMFSNLIDQKMEQIKKQREEYHNQQYNIYQNEFSDSHIPKGKSEQFIHVKQNSNFQIEKQQTPVIRSVKVKESEKKEGEINKVNKTNKVNKSKKAIENSNEKKHSIKSVNYSTNALTKAKIKESSIKGEVKEKRIKSSNVIKFKESKTSDVIKNYNATFKKKNTIDKKQIAPSAQLNDKEIKSNDPINKLEDIQSYVQNLIANYKSNV